MQATLTFLGTGTSMGVPTLGCGCAVCTSAVDGTEPRNRRTRPSVSIRFGEPIHTVLIDTGPDFHHQAIRERLTHVDAVLYTHHHADHILGMDDLRPLSYKNGIPLYADESTTAVLERVFAYTFRTENRYITSARVSLNALPAAGETFPLFGADFRRIDVTHGRETITGYRFGGAAYLTDMSGIPKHSLPHLQNLDILILDALRREPHPSHSHLANSIALAQQLNAKRTYFTHMSHDLDHDQTEQSLPENVHLAYDGLQLTFDLPQHD